MSNLNWPEGATHYLQAGEEETRFRDLSGEQWKYFNSYTGEWVQHYFSSEDLLRRHDLIPRPQPKPWSGPEDGLPPVGSVLHLKRASKFTEGTRLDEFPAGTKIRVGGYANFGGHDVLAVIVEGRNFTGTIIPELLMPIKTPEQLAAEKRETAIRELMDIAQVDCRVTAARLVDAGFKREVV